MTAPTGGQHFFVVSVASVMAYTLGPRLVICGYGHEVWELSPHDRLCYWDWYTYGSIGFRCNRRGVGYGKP